MHTVTGVTIEALLDLSAQRALLVFLLNTTSLIVRETPLLMSTLAPLVLYPPVLDVLRFNVAQQELSALDVWLDTPSTLVSVLPVPQLPTVRSVAVQLELPSVLIASLVIISRPLALVLHVVPALPIKFSQRSVLETQPLMFILVLLVPPSLDAKALLAQPLVLLVKLVCLVIF